MSFPNIGPGGASDQAGTPRVGVRMANGPQTFKTGVPKLKGLKRPDPRLARAALVSGMKGAC